MKNTSKNTDGEFLTYYFLPDERELWRGKSKGTDPFQRVFMVSFGIVLLLFSLFMTIGTIISEGTLAPLVVGVPFVGVSLYLIFGRGLIVKNTIYVVTNYKIYRCRSNKIDTLDMANLPTVRVETRNDGTGTVYFGERITTSFAMRNITYRNDFVIENVDNIAELEEVIRVYAKESKSNTTITEEE